jgi:hypothetical protein
MQRDDNQDALLEALSKLLIAQLLLAGVDGHTVRKIAGVEMKRVTMIAKALKKRKKTTQGG